MKSQRPKVLHEVCGKPMLDYVLDACFGAGCERVIVVVGHGKDEVIDAFGARQADHLGRADRAARHRPRGADVRAATEEASRRRVHPRRRRAAHSREVLQTLLAGASATTTPPPAWRPRCSTTRPATAGSFATTTGEFRRDRRAARLHAASSARSAKSSRAIYCVKVDELLFALSQAEEREQEGRILPDRHLRHPAPRGQKGRRGAGGDGGRRARRQHARSSSPRSTRSCRTASSAACARPA